MEATQWIAAICFIIWGLAHVMFGLATFSAASKNDLFAVWEALIGAHPNIASFEKPSKALPKGPNSLFKQHALNVVKPGTISTLLGLWIIPFAADDTIWGPYVAFVMTIDVFFDHNFYGVIVDWAGYAPPVATFMYFVANTGVICEIYDLTYRAEIINKKLGLVWIILPAVMIAIQLVIVLGRLTGVIGYFGVEEAEEIESAKEEI